MPERKSTFKRGLIFQLKLGLDALRDLVLSPVAIVFLIMDFINNTPKEESRFSKLLQWGHESDKWINLFEQHDDTDQEQETYRKVDDLLDNIEEMVKKQRQTPDPDNPEIKIKIKQRIEDALNQLKSEPPK